MKTNLKKILITLCTLLTIVGCKAIIIFAPVFAPRVIMKESKVNKDTTRTMNIKTVNNNKNKK